MALLPDSLDDPANARALCHAAQLAYAPPDVAIPAFRADLGLEAEFVSVNNTQVYVARDDRSLAIVFRGSEGPTSLDGLKDWLVTNAANLLIQPQGPLATEFLAAGVGARWHQGFVGAITETWPALWPVIDTHLTTKERTVWVVGHSLGGALALMCAWLMLRNTRPPERIVTFGAPMVGNAPVAQAFDREFPGQVVRYVNSDDPVPLLPMMSLIANDFLHCQTGVVLGASEQAANLLDYLRLAGGGAIDGLLHGEAGDKVWQAVKAKVLAHLLPDYTRLLAT